MQLLLNETLIDNLRKNQSSVRSTVSDIAIKGLSLEIRPSGEGSWRYRYSYEGKQECVSIGLLSQLSLYQARNLALELLDRVQHGHNPAIDQRKLTRAENRCITYEDFINEYYLPHIRSYKRCVTADITLLQNHLLPAFGKKRMNQITREDVLSFQSEKQSAGYKPAYCNRFLVLLGFCFNLAMRWELPGVTKNPVKLVSLLKANNKKQRFLTPEESIKLMIAIKKSPNPMLKYFVPLALLTGLRKREILDAKWEHIDWECKLWLIPHSKSGYARRIPLNSESIAVLRDLQKNLPELLSQPGLLENSWVIPNWQTGKPFRSIFNSWDTARRQAGLSDLRIHDLRHSFASAMVNQGVPIYDVQKLLGHSDVKTTERYAHLSIDRLRQSTTVVNSFYDFNLTPSEPKDD